jgi:hypothetical protein
VDGHHRCDLDDCEPEFGPSFPAGRDSPPVTQPAVGAFDRPAVPGVGVGGFRAQPAPTPDLTGWCAGRDRLAWPALPANPRIDPARQQLRVQVGRRVATVGPQLGRDQAAAEQVVNERQQLGALVLVARADPDREGGAARVDR